MKFIWCFWFSSWIFYGELYNFYHGVVLKYYLLTTVYFQGFDAPQIFYSDNFGDTGDAQTGDNATANNLAIKKRFKEFLRQYSGAGNFSFKYRDALKKNYTLRQFWISVNLEDLARFVFTNSLTNCLACPFRLNVLRIVSYRTIKCIKSGTN